MKAAVVIVCFLVLAGCAQVGIGTKDECEQIQKALQEEKSYFSRQLAEEQQKSYNLEARLEDCIVNKKGLEAKVSSAEIELSRLKNESQLLGMIEEKVKESMKVEELDKYYQEAFGPKGIPNTYRIKKMEEIIRALNDSQMEKEMLALKNCDNPVSCQKAKEAFVETMRKRQEMIMEQIREIVRKSGPLEN
ncbi:MAG: hypothetical protein N3G80_01455 [Candidatus Micrarchaeota archaeon]|nr:hypothetical protein [Candidatus Micrarchaeota archaeon]